MAWFEHGTSRIYYEEEGSGEPLLMIPGWSLSIEDMAPLRQALAPHYHVIAADAPGSGKSGPQPREFTASYYDDDSRSFLALLHSAGAAPAHIVGFSDGGEYALIMAELEPAAVRSIAAWGAAGQQAAPPPMLQAFAEVVDSPIPPLQEFSDYLKSMYGENNARIMTQTVAKAWGEIIDRGGDMSRKRAGEIACPAILITGEHDFLAPPSIVSELAGAMQRAEFVEAKGATHTVHHEQPEWLTKTIADWLAKR
ncbi:MAG TPA: alpha/beta hydrolase [Dehalococcoidia bacterium]|nr:alpha/beta hydrolase [Dehalococcoidia bacterium]